jgi:hypothetical protein
VWVFLRSFMFDRCVRGCSTSTHEAVGTNATLFDSLSLHDIDEREEKRHCRDRNRTKCCSRMPFPPYKAGSANASIVVKTSTTISWMYNSSRFLKRTYRKTTTRASDALTSVLAIGERMDRAPLIKRHARRQLDSSMNDTPSMYKKLKRNAMEKRLCGPIRKSAPDTVMP